ncbi:pseudouridine synthase [Sphingomonas sp. GlSt437]|uniref:pseudouridine synthase n=1 Tax=Sphingomonas sp. GlSt437 TaxID=3389970 RepID=UPI003A8647ED
MTKFSLPDRDGQRIAKLLARAGIASRREIERMIVEGRVALNGKPIDTPATVLKSLHGVTVDGKPVAEPTPARLFLFHKPNGVLVTERDPGGRPTIYDRLPKGLPRLMPVGRLDLNTEGLLLLTTDGELKRQLELPSTGVERAYRARAYGQVTQAQLEDLIEGVEIDGVRYGSIDANLERRTGANVWIEIIITEGKNREVRKVLEHLGLKVSRLIRTRYGPFVLGDLPMGEIGEVRQADVAAFRRQPKKRGAEAPMRLKQAVPPPRPKPDADAEAPRSEGPRRNASPGKLPPRPKRATPQRASRKQADGPADKPLSSRARRTLSDPRRATRDDAPAAPRSPRGGRPARPGRPRRPGKR